MTIGAHCLWTIGDHSRSGSHPSQVRWIICRGDFSCCWFLCIYFVSAQWTTSFWSEFSHKCATLFGIVLGFLDLLPMISTVTLVLTIISLCPQWRKWLDNMNKMVPWPLSTPTTNRWLCGTVLLGTWMYKGHIMVLKRFILFRKCVLF